MRVTTRASRDDDPAAVVSAPVRLQLLGGFELVVDGAPIDVSAAAQRVVAYLALQAHPQHRALVASSLWVDLTEGRATANLRAALWRLRGARDRIITARGSHLSLATQVRVDIASVVRKARELLDAGQGREEFDGPAPLAADLDLLSRDLLPDWDEDWIVFERERLRQLRLHAMEALSAQLRCCGRHADAVEAGLSAVAADPLRESAQRVLIEAHLAEGNLADARRQFDSFRLLLRDELGVAPSPALAVLVRLSSSGGAGEC